MPSLKRRRLDEETDRAFDFIDHPENVRVVVKNYKVKQFHVYTTDDS